VVIAIIIWATLGIGVKIQVFTARLRHVL